MDFRALREKARLSQKDLALLSGVNQVTVSQLELGKVRDPRWSTITAIATTLNITPGALMKAIERTAAHRGAA
jgi:transcriptional regulator with XRE-family HTH domain